MRTTYFRPTGLLAGFMASCPDPEVPELIHIGEQWAPREFFIDVHTHAVWELYVQVSGESRWQSGNDVYTLAPGGLFVAAPEIEHTMHERPQSKHHFYFAAVDLNAIFKRLPHVAPDWEGRDIIYTARAESTLAPFRQLIREISVELPYRTSGIQIALDALVLEASRVSRVRSSVTNLVALHPAIARAKELMDHHPEGRWPLADLARVCGLSANHLVERFTSEIGRSPRQYLLHTRVLKAQELLAQTELPVTDIGLELGFCSGQHFTVSFKKVTGTTPIKYRRLHMAQVCEG